MLSSLLTYLPDERGFEVAIATTVALARPSSARVVGVTVLDTREAEAACLSESAVGAAAACEQLGELARRSEAAHARLGVSCRALDLPWQTRLLRGDPRQLLPRESQFHDLIVTALDPKQGAAAVAGGPTLADLADLVRRGAQPMLVVRPQRQLPRRVLLTFDGSKASGSTVRSFFHLGLLPDAECRLLVTGTTAAAARSSFRDMADYCYARRADMEMGWTVGPAMRVLSTFAKKWNADAIVMHLPREPFRWPWAPSKLERLQRALPHCAFFLKA